VTVMSDENDNIRVEITDASESRCFRLVLNPNSRSACCQAAIDEWATGDCYCTACRRPLGAPQRLAIMLHTRGLVDLIHKCSLALCDWQAQTAVKYCEELKEFLAKKW
jgi:hypothetical protein